MSGPIGDRQRKILRSAKDRTWALACGVPEVLIDRQLGHAARAGGEEMVLLRVVQGSRVGRQHYTDMRSAMLDASRSAVAVRQLLDEAMARLAGIEQPAAGEPEVASGYLGPPRA